MGKHSRPATAATPAPETPAPDPSKTASEAAPSPQVDTAPENMAATIAADGEPATPAAFPDKPAAAPASKAEPATPQAPATPASAPDLHGDPQAIAARIAELGDPHSRVVAASNRLADIVKHRFEEVLRLEREENEARWNVQRVQSVAQVEKEELRLLKLRLAAIEAAEAKAKQEADEAKKNAAPVKTGGAAS